MYPLGHSAIRLDQAPDLHAVREAQQGRDAVNTESVVQAIGVLGPLFPVAALADRAFEQIHRGQQVAAGAAQDWIGGLAIRAPARAGEGVFGAEKQEKGRAFGDHQGQVALVSVGRCGAADDGHGRTVPPPGTGGSGGRAVRLHPASHLTVTQAGKCWGAMAASFTVILRACPAGQRAVVGQFLGKAFSLKESTCTAIAESAPIILLSALTVDEAAAMRLALISLDRLGANLDFTSDDIDDLPKIDWPRRPQVFKRDIAELAEDLRLTVPLPDGTERSLLELLVAPLTGKSLTVAVPSVRTPAPVAAPAVDRSKEFRGIQLPEITPFSTPVLPSGPGTPVPSANDDPLARLNELFPEDGGGFVPNNDEVTSMLNRLLPDEEGATTTPSGAATSSSGRQSVIGASGWSLFLAKIADEGRRAKAVPLIAELGKLPVADAEVLSKKVIIPVLKGVPKDEAEAARQKFAKIGILARVKGPE